MSIKESTVPPICDLMYVVICIAAYFMSEVDDLSKLSATKTRSRLGDVRTNQCNPLARASRLKRINPQRWREQNRYVSRACEHLSAAEKKALHVDDDDILHSVITSTTFSRAVGRISYTVEGVLWEFQDEKSVAEIHSRR